MNGIRDAEIRRPAVAGAFYPGVPARLSSLVDRQLDDAAGIASSPAPRSPRRRGLLVPHAGLVYSGVVAAAGWRLLASGEGDDITVVVLGTNHGAGWLDGVGIWERGEWLTPVGPVGVDDALAAEIAALGPPFVVDRAAHLDEHSIEVQLPFIQAVAPSARIVPLAVSAGIGADALAAGARLGSLLAERAGDAGRVVLAISSDMAHYPPADVCAAATKSLVPAIAGLDAERLARDEVALRRSGVRGLSCGMCGIEPAVLGLAAFAAMPGTVARPILAATSADAGGSPDRTVGYLSVAFEWEPDQAA